MSYLTLTPMFTPSKLSHRLLWRILHCYRASWDVTMQLWRKLRLLGHTSNQTCYKFNTGYISLTKVDQHAPPIGGRGRRTVSLRKHLLLLNSGHRYKLVDFLLEVYWQLLETYTCDRKHRIASPSAARQRNPAHFPQTYLKWPSCRMKKVSKS